MARSFALPVDMASTNSRPRAKGWIAVIGITAIGILALDFVMNTQVPMQEVGRLLNTRNMGPSMFLDPTGDVSDRNFGLDDSLFDLTP